MSLVNIKNSFFLLRLVHFGLFHVLHPFFYYERMETTRVILDTFLCKPIFGVIYFCAEYWFFRFPRMFGGYENLDQVEICSQILHRPSFELRGEDGRRLCDNLLFEKISAYAYLAIAVICGFSLQQTWFLVRSYLAPSIPKHAITIINQQNDGKLESQSPSRRRTRSTEQVEKAKETQIINTQSTFLLRQVLDAIEDSTEDVHVKYEWIVKAVRNADPVLVKRFQHSTVLSIDRQHSVSLLKNE